MVQEQIAKVGAELFKAVFGERDAAALNGDADDFFEAGFERSGEGCDGRS